MQGSLVGCVIQVAGPRAPPPQAHRRCTPRACAADAATTSSDLYMPLGKTATRISRLGIGTLQWGDPGCGWGTQYDAAQLQQVFDAAVAAGITLVDTAEVYGYQGTNDGTSSEHLVGGFAAAAAPAPGTPPLVLATKFFPVPWTNALVGGGIRLGRASLVEALRASVQRLGVQCVDLYQVHFPFPTFSAATLADALAEGRDQGLLREVGVCNHSAAQMRDMHRECAARGMTLASNQVKYSLLDRSPERSGLLDACGELGVTLIAHTPLEQGLLTAKQLEGSNPKATVEVRALLKLLAFIGTLLGGKSASQVALNYLMQKGAVPIPGCKSVAQVQEHAGALGWALDDNEMGIIDEKLAAMGK